MSRRAIVRRSCRLGLPSHTDRLRRSPNAFRRPTGITPTAFDRLPAQLVPLHEAAEIRRKARPDPLRRPGVGPKRELPLSERLPMLLIYDRTDTTHVLLGVDGSAVRRNIKPLRPLPAGIRRIPEREVSLDPEDIREPFFDATERPTRWPKEGRRKFYSGKKKRHTIKTQVVVVRRSGPQAPQGADRVGARPDDRNLYDRTRVETPAHKPEGGELTADLKERNRVPSRRRIVAE